MLLVNCNLYSDHKQIKYFENKKKQHRIHSQEWMAYNYQTLDNGNEYVYRNIEIYNAISVFHVAKMLFKYLSPYFRCHWFDFNERQALLNALAKRNGSGEFSHGNYSYKMFSCRRRCCFRSNVLLLSVKMLSILWDSNS